MNHHPECKDATIEHPGSCVCTFIKRREAMDKLIAQDADLIALHIECQRCCGNGQTYGPNSGEDIICPDCSGKGRQ